MSILLENQFHCTTGPLAQFFSSLDVHNQEALSLFEVQRFAEAFCVRHAISFVHKKILLLMVAKGFSKYNQSSSRLSFSDLLPYARKLLFVFASSQTNAAEYQQDARQKHARLSKGKTHITTSDLAEYCASCLPCLIPNKKILALFFAYTIHQICSHHPGCSEHGISQEAWTETALGLFFEIEHIV